MLRPRRTLAAGLTVLAAAGLAACGDDDDDSGSADAQEITTVAKTWMTGDRTAEQCNTLVTPRYIAQVLGTAADCRKRASSSERPDSADFSDVQVDGDKASLRVQTKSQGYTLDGRMELAKADGKWKLDAIDDSLIAQTISATFDTAQRRIAKQRDIPDGENLIDQAKFGDCVTQKLQALPAARLKAVGDHFLVDKETPAARKDANVTINGCLGESEPGRKVIRGLFEAGLRERIGNRAGVDSDCIISKLRTGIDDQSVSDLVNARAAEQTDSDAEGKLRSAANKAEADCKKS